jgi:hypothetical protein
MLPHRAQLGAWGLALGLLACGDDSFTPTEATVAGSYAATTFTAATAGGPVDLLAEGMTVTITLRPDGMTTGRLYLAGGGDNGVDLDEDLTGSWTLDGKSVRFSQSANTFIRDAEFTAGLNTLTTQGTFGDTTLRLVLTKAL